MAWQYNNRNGKLYHNGEYIAKGYSGNGEGLNNPGFEWKTNVGPIPAGWYHIGQPHTSARTGSFVLDLIPVNHTSLGRKYFQIHGDNRRMNHSASSGCIILPRRIREKIVASGDVALYVIGAFKTMV